MKFFKISPLTQKRLQRFRRSKIAFGSLCLLITIFVISLCSELIANSEPLMMRYNGKLYFPFLHSTTPQELLEAANEVVHINYRDFTASETFKRNASNYAIFAPVRYSPGETLDRNDLEKDKEVTITYRPTQPIGRFNLTAQGNVIRQDNCEQFFATTVNLEDEQSTLTDLFELDEKALSALQQRMNVTATLPAETFSIKVKTPKTNDYATLHLTMPAVDATQGTPASLRINIAPGNDTKALFRQSYIFKFQYDNSAEVPVPTLKRWTGPCEPSEELMAHVNGLTAQAFKTNLAERDGHAWVAADGTRYAIFSTNNARFPFHPTGAHPFGLDSSGRDVFARILYATRIALSFGLILATTATILGLIIGSIQGYFGGKLDIVIQRFTEIWAALPFLYIMVLVGKAFSRSFWLLLIVYGMFCWLGLSYYMRAEFLRLRNRPFVAAARCQGLSNARIIFRHILPNALTPIITLFPFLLVGAIGSLVSLDFLGFGLPPLTPSWGELLSQAQEHRASWWLIFFPSLAIFLVMFLTVMVGEGVRNAFDPKPFSKLQ